MFYNRQFSNWYNKNSLSSIQEIGREPNTIARLKEIKENGYNVSDFHLETARQRSETVKRLYNFAQLPDVWPFKLAKQLFKALPNDWANKLKASRIGEVYLDEINAIALDGDIGILIGLSNFFLMCSYATSPFNYIVKDINRSAIELGIQLKNVCAKLITSTSFHEYGRYQAESVSLRSRLAEEFPKERPLIERFAASAANDMIGFVIMHELAHIILKHKKATGNKSQEQEYEADKYALNTLIDIFPDLGINPIAGALAMSFLEANDRINGVSLKGSIEFEVNGSHPPLCQRRCEILETAAQTFYKKKVSNHIISVLLTMAHMMHIELSSLLENSGFDPLVSFHHSWSLKYYGITSIPEFIKYASKKVTELELYPYHKIGLI